MYYTKRMNSCNISEKEFKFKRQNFGSTQKIDKLRIFLTDLLHFKENRVKRKTIRNERTSYDSKKKRKQKKLSPIIETYNDGHSGKIIITKTYNDTSTPKEKRDLFRIY